MMCLKFDHYLQNSDVMGLAQIVFTFTWLLTTRRREVIGLPHLISFKISLSKTTHQLS